MTKLNLALVDTLSTPVFAIDVEHNVIGWNPACEELTGVKAVDVLGTNKHWTGFYPEARPCLCDLVLDKQLANVRKFYTQQEAATFDKTAHRAEGWFVLNGTRRFLAFEAKPLVVDGAIVGALEIFQDITAHKLLEEKLELSARVFEHASEGIVITNANNEIISLNAAMESLSGFSASEAIGKNPNLFSSDRHPNSFFKSMWKTLKKQKHWQGEIWNSKKDGTEYLVKAYVSAVFTDGVASNYIGIYTDITESRKALDKIDHMAHHDFLTGLPNRMLLEDRIQQAMARTQRGATKFAVLFLDLDKFKVVNDTLGHATGDQLLTIVANRITGCTRACDTVSRQGGDEFVILMEDVKDMNDISSVAHKIADAIRHPVTIKTHTLAVTSSIGISVFPDDGASVSDLLKHADSAMYHAKKLGKNNFQFFKESINTKVLEALSIETSLRNSLPQGLRVVYQPQLCVVSGKVHGVEALARWRCPERGEVSPGVFIPVAEESGLIREIGAQVLAEACKVMRLADINMSVNLSPLQLAQPDIVSIVEKALGGLAGHRLTLEITESSIIADLEKTKKTLLKLKEIGVSLALDDFGTGFSSLSYLYQLPFDYLKVDQSFVRNPNNGPIVRAILEMGNRLNMFTVGEGVETTDQHRFMVDNGCDYIQGYLFSKPLELSALMPFLDSHKTAAIALPAKKGGLPQTKVWTPLVSNIDTQCAEMDQFNTWVRKAESKGDYGAIRLALKGLIQHVMTQFMDEDTFMLKIGYPKMLEHRRAHSEYLANLAKFELALKDTKMFAASTVSHYLCMRNEHLDTMDRELAAYANAHGVPIVV